MSGEALSVCLVANRRYPICEPFAGGLESMTWHLARELVRRGHRVEVFAAPGSDPALGVQELVPRPRDPQGLRWDLHPPAHVRHAEDAAYRRLVDDLARTAVLEVGGGSRPDVVHNHSLSPVVLDGAARIGVPFVSTLHTPPEHPLADAARRAAGTVRFAAVSRATAAAWADIVPVGCVPNGVDTDLWTPGPGGDSVVWFGRMVPEKAPHQAVDAARAAGLPIVLAGPVIDHTYVATEVLPRLGPDVQMAGHLHHRELVELVGSSAAALVTPIWDEPYGLVAAEALSCGTPVAGYDSGGLSEVVGDCGRLVRPGDVGALATALQEAVALDRCSARRRAVEHLSLDLTVDRYEALYRELISQEVR